MFDRTVLPIPPYQKPGKIAPTIKDSEPIKWPVEISARKGAPNVLLIMTDDVGFGGTELFGATTGFIPPLQSHMSCIVRRHPQGMMLCFGQPFVRPPDARRVHRGGESHER